MAASRIKKRLLVSALSLVGFLGLLELGLRFFDFRYAPIDAPMVVWNVIEDRALRLGTSLHQADPRQLWKPDPGKPIPWGQDEVINGAGYRGPRIPLERREDSVRIATLGDSSTFGHSVAASDTYTAQLAEQLAAEGVAVEVLNGGVIGFTVRQGIERYLDLVRPHRPDFVVAAFGAVNDHLNAIEETDDVRIPQDVSEHTTLTELRMFLRRESRIMHLASRVVDASRGGRDDDREKHFRRARRKHKLLASLGRIDWKGRRRVSIEEFERFLTQLNRLVETFGARLILLSMPRQREVEKANPVLLLYTQAIERVAEREGALLADGRGAFHREIAAGTPVQELFADRYHPTRAGHALLAAEIARIVTAELEAAESE